MPTVTSFNATSLEYAPSALEILNLTNIKILGTPNATTFGFDQLDNAFRVRFTGTGFQYDSLGNVIGGTITSVQIYTDSGVLYQNITGLSASLEDALAAGSTFGNNFGRWLLREGTTYNASSHVDQGMTGSYGNDIFNGIADENVSIFMVGGAGADTYNGNTSFEQISWDDAYRDPTAFRGVAVRADLGTAVDPWGFNETFSNIDGFRGTQFNDSFVGGALSELFMGLGGRDVINGGAGNDEVRYDRDINFGGNRGVTVDLNAGFAIDGWGHRDTLTSIERIRATNFNDSLTGNSDANRIRAFDGNDTINGLAGADDMRGGAGNDTYYVDNAGDIVDEASDGGNGLDTVVSTVTFSLTTSATVLGVVENLTLIGGANINGTGNDQNNVIFGNSGVNILNGGAGNDTINGGLGADTLIGGSGIDRFAFNTALTSIDRINDFDVVDDTIWLARSIFSGIATTGVLAAGAFKTLGTSAVDADDRILYNKATGAILYDADGSGSAAAVQFATVTANLALTNADFLVS